MTYGAKPRRCGVLRLGMVDYEEAWDRQKALAEVCHDEPSQACLILLEHPPTYTLGRGGDKGNILVDDAEMARLGAKVFHIDRGGDVTFHGPGQLVGYPIISLPAWGIDVHSYLRSLEEILIRVAADFGVEAGRIRGLTGVWAGEEKIAAIGIKVSRGVTTHGFALNVDTDLTYFDQIFPCGLKDRRATSLAKLMGRAVDMDEVARSLVRRFGEEFAVEIEGE